MAQLKGNERSAFVASMFGRISRRYDFLNTLMTGGMHYVWRKSAAKLTASDISGDVLDIASGTGDFAFNLLKYPNIETVVGLDFSPNMLDVAVEKSSKLGFENEFVVAVGDAHSLPFSDESFAGATIGFGVRNFADLPKALADIVRVTKRGGRVTILEIVIPKGKLSATIFISYFKWITPKMGRLFAGDSEAYKYLPESVESFMSSDQLTEHLEKAGLINVTVQTKGFGSIAIISGERP
ncbi:MAG: ubiquinone/menaquinone biosynthesis methyltransferase [SAR202 cluster bacterium]|nr:MAG: ubiquinone/menaquinone biosynthesis methyltransferase [SAR202 cluster bacterium]MEC7733763.1 ubiquinone/menaquinone biosynthesis methyltransferase [Chloroflexota bacterium]MEC8986384.1 ubiquinone/menaquinone biosynthesis methyltransferase [Chloroflexota bacterium]MEC9365484.1 ubiquinone/menaquinone biosynthesis methyltransferase [Chloroflexota bacterium]MED5409124.1 ubiquinone/menaquinone biosynthesis methyltransferase [Chloroflexota bacterium]